VLKWAGGKTQLIPELIDRVPKKFNKYIEPVFGGGALFFALRPRFGVIAESNPELINMYTAVREDVDGVINHLAQHRNEKDYFYEIRSQEWREMPPVQAAARTIFLNRTCFNGLYRVNRSGG